MDKGRRVGYKDLSRREVAAMLVHCAYFRDLAALAWPVAKLMGYQDDRSERYGGEFWAPWTSVHNVIPKTGKLKELRVAFYLRKDKHPIMATGPAPRLVIALRGTLLYLKKDLKEDLSISGELLLESERVKECLILIEKVIKEFLSTPGRSKDEICLAGHSLGAGIALLVGKHLATSGTEIDTHLFAPPLLTLASIASDLLHHASGVSPNELQVLFFNKLTDRMKESGVGVVVTDEEKHSGVGTIGDAIVETFGKRDLDQEWKEFQKLRDWVPHFYLNRSDFICVHYITYYEEQNHRRVAATRHNIDISEQGIITRFFGGDAKYINNVVPSANLYISKLYEGRHLKAHSLKQWHKFTNGHIKLKESQARLLSGYKDHTTERAMQYSDHKLHDAGHQLHDAGHKLHELGRSVLSKGRFTSRGRANFS
ncbi:hypothetical protein KC19_2G049400 [Ceratodon purpureus]|uniref:Fungal lipase-like domain-containing protein n=1 Tax=Ceratodon purpureus TaxID=3225 RepID=A0A8T0IS57_CERPU|nr:hypothetical protein KC19_2G049400 [Ceratodon purpureus]